MLQIMNARCTKRWVWLTGGKLKRDADTNDKIVEGYVSSKTHLLKITKGTIYDSERNKTKHIISMFRGSRMRYDEENY